MALTYVIVERKNCIDNIQEETVSTSTTMIIVNESGLKCRRTTFPDATIVSIINKNTFDGNYDTSLIDIHSGELSIDTSYATDNPVPILKSVWADVDIDNYQNESNDCYFCISSATESVFGN